MVRVHLIRLTIITSSSSIITRRGMVTGVVVVVVCIQEVPLEVDHLLEVIYIPYYGCYLLLIGAWVSIVNF
jgi:hypothetical protein